MDSETRCNLGHLMVKLKVIKDPMIYVDWMFVNLSENEEQKLLHELFIAQNSKVFDD